MALLAAGLLPAAAAADPRPPAVAEVYHPQPPALLAPGLDPILRTWRSGRALMGCGLFRIDGRGRPRPDLARRARSLEDGRIWEVELKDGLLLADGSALDAVAFASLWNQQIQGRAEARWLLAPLSRPPVAVQRLRLRFELSEPLPALPARLAHPWLALLEPATRERRPSSLGPYRALPSRPAGGDLLLQASADHDHGLSAPIDLRVTRSLSKPPLSACAAEAVSYEWIFGPEDEASEALRERVDRGLERLRRSPAAGPMSDPGRAAAAASGPWTLELLIPGSDTFAADLAAQAQADLLDQGVRLRVRPLDEADLERQLRAGRYQAALLGMAPALGDPALDLEARLAATGRLEGSLRQSLERARAEPAMKARRRIAEDLLAALRVRLLQVPIRRRTACVEMAGGISSPALAWSATLSLRSFERRPALPEP